MAVKMKSKETAGPPLALAFPMVLNIPAPIIAAIAKAVKSLTFNDRRRLLVASLSK